MGPRHQCRGMGNAARTMETWFLLQWGRGINAAEWLRSLSKEVWPLPLQWGRGINAAECAVSPRTDRRSTSLQWGRGIDAAELSAGTSQTSSRAALQWGRGIDAAECVDHDHVVCDWSSFNGAAASMPRNGYRGMDTKRA